MRRRPNDPRLWAAALGASAGFAAVPAIAVEEAMTAPAAQAADQPVTLVVRQDGRLIDARVIAATQCDCGGSFRIESQTGSSNRSVNTSSFGPLQEVGRVLSHVRFGGSDEWRVRLTVSIDGREDYVIVRSSDAEL
ncbi:hypothetical protein [Blastomonas sp. AAP53]|uniref:hypothetical protein n=1 Tax=Blastomonas sp. AAP53 TaxID=1248760 RepID=UPI0003768C17|nr:hypothetical protein [Blastomonas sp. AAP53]